MKGKSVNAAPVAILIGWLALCAVAVAGAGERLDYKVTYHGLLTLGQEMQIADVLLQTALTDDGLRETRLEATSAAYSTVESVYPIRYRVRTWTSTDQGELVAFETYENARKLKHRLYLRDDSELGVRLLDVAAGQGRAEMAQLDAGRNPVAAPDEKLLFDRLGLLQRIRGLELRERQVFRLPVTNGREPFAYRVTVEGAESVTLGGVAVPAWKLRFEGQEMPAGKAAKPAHRPVYIWVSRTPEHIPLRADSRHAVGVFRIELDAPSAPQLVARAPTS